MISGSLLTRHGVSSDSG